MHSTLILVVYNIRVTMWHFFHTQVCHDRHCLKATADSIVQTTTLLWFNASRMSDKTLSLAVSVDWCVAHS